QTTSSSDPYSFPSAHTSAAFTMATLVNLRYPAKPYIYVPMYALSLIVGYGRVYLGKHYPVDAFAGMLIGGLCSTLIYSLRVDLIKFKSHIFGEISNDDYNADLTIPKSLAYLYSISAASFLINEFFHKVSFLPYITNTSKGITIHTNL